MRSPNFNPWQDEAKAAKGHKSWCVPVPPDLSPTGKRQRLFFWTRVEALQETQQFRQQLRDFGKSQDLLTYPLKLEALEVYKLLQKEGIDEGLLPWVRRHINQDKEQDRKRKHSLELGQLFEQYLDARKHTSPHYRREVGLCRKRFQHHMEVLACDLDFKQIEQELDQLTDSMFNGQLTILRTVINYAVTKGVIESNPLMRLEKKQLKWHHDHDGEVQILPPEHVQAMLNDALQNDPEVLPYLILGFFTGCRVTEELPGLTWKRIIDNHLVIPKNIAKKRRRRVVPLEPNALQWLALCKHPPTTPIVPFTYNVADNRRDAICKRLGITYPKNAMRHSFASYHLIHFGEEVDTCGYMGEKNAKTLYDHYINSCKKADAERFWAIVPSTL